MQSAVGTSPARPTARCRRRTPLFDGSAGSDGVVRVPDLHVPAGTLLPRTRLEPARSACRTRSNSVAGTVPDGRRRRRTERPTRERGARRPRRGLDDAPRPVGDGGAVDRRRHLPRHASTTPQPAARPTSSCSGAAATSRTLCLRDATDADLQCTDGTGSIAFNDVVLAAGDYRLAVSGVADPDDPYLLRFDVTAEATSGFEAEPNDTACARDSARRHAVTIRSGAGRVCTKATSTCSAGRSRASRSCGRSPRPAPASAHRRAGGRRVLRRPRRRRRRRRRRLTDVFLLPGDHTFSVSGPSGDYTIDAVPLGPPAPDAEREPNDGGRSRPADPAARAAHRTAAAGDGRRLTIGSRCRTSRTS